MRIPAPSTNVPALTVPRDLAIRCQESQQSLPAHLRYDPQCWQSNLSPNICLMLTVMHLNYLQNYFQVQRLLAKTDPEASNIVLRISAETVATVLQIGNCLNRAIFMRHDFPYVVSTFSSIRVAQEKLTITGTLLRPSCGSSSCHCTSKRRKEPRQCADSRRTESLHASATSLRVHFSRRKHLLTRRRQL